MDAPAPGDEARWTDRRTRYLARAVGLREPVARTLAWRELGYSSSGIAKRVDVEENTIRSRLDDLSERFDPSVFETRTDQFAIDRHPGQRGRSEDG